MGKASTIDLLNRLFVLLYRSLPMYLNSAHPWIHQGQEGAPEVLSKY